MGCFWVGLRMMLGIWRRLLGRWRKLEVSKAPKPHQVLTRLVKHLSERDVQPRRLRHGLPVWEARTKTVERRKGRKLLLDDQTSSVVVLKGKVLCGADGGSQKGLPANEVSEEKFSRGVGMPRNRFGSGV
mgnify:CR=1 FL=1